MSIQIKSLIEAIDALINNTSHKNCLSELKNVVIDGSDPNQAFDLQKLNSVLDYFNFILSSITSLKAAKDNASYTLAIDNYKQNTLNKCSDITYILHPPNALGSPFTYLTESYLKDVESSCPTIYNYYLSISNQLNVDNQNVAISNTTSNNISVDNLSSYKDQLITNYNCIPQDSSDFYSSSNIQKYPVRSLYLSSQQDFQLALNNLLKQNFQFSNLNNILSSITQLQTIQKSITFRSKLVDRLVNYSSYGLILEPTNFNNYIICVGEIIRILNSILDLAKQAGIELNSTIISPINTDISNTNSTIKNTEDTSNKIKLIPESWGVKFSVANPSYGQLASIDQAGPQLPVGYYYMNLLPAQSSTIPMQGGRDVPNAMPGLSIRIVPNIGKHKVPGFQPVFQNLGMSQIVITLVGSFTGADGAVNKTDSINKGSTELDFNKQGTSNLLDNPKPLLTKLDSVIENLNSYNSLQEFYNFSTRQGKQIEVEINLLKAYQGNLEAIKEFADIKLQSENGNPKFTAIVRNIEAYHRSKDRTWYTVILEVTDFGLASKTPINLNVKLDAQIAKAQASQKAINSNVTPNSTEGNILNDAANAIGKLPLEDQKKYAAILKWCQVLIQEAKSSSLYIKPENTTPIIEQIQQSPSNTFSYLQAIPLENNEVLLKIVINADSNNVSNNRFIKLSDGTIIETGGLIGAATDLTKGFVNLITEMENRSNIDRNSEQTSYFLFSTKDIIKEYSKQQRGPYKNEIKLHGTDAELDAKLSTRLNKLTAPEIVASLGKALGCAGTTLVSQVIIGGVTTGGIGGLVGATNIVTQCIGGLGDDLYASYLNNSKDTEDWKYTKDQLFSAKSIGDFILSISVQVAIDVAFRGIGGAFKEGLKGARSSITEGFKQGNLIKQGVPLAENLSGRLINKLGGEISAPNTTVSIPGVNLAITNIPARLLTLTNPETSLVGKVINLKNGTSIKVNKVIPGSNSTDEFVLIGTDLSNTRNVPVLLKDIESVPEDIFTTTSTVINNSTNTSTVSNNTTSITPSANSIIKPTSVSQTNQILEGILKGPNGSVTPGMKITTNNGNTYEVELLGAVKNINSNSAVSVKQIGKNVPITIYLKDINEITYPSNSNLIQNIPEDLELPETQVRNPRLIETQAGNPNTVAYKNAFEPALPLNSFTDNTLLYNPLFDFQVSFKDIKNNLSTQFSKTNPLTLKIIASDGSLSSINVLSISNLENGYRVVIQTVDGTNLSIFPK